MGDTFPMLVFHPVINENFETTLNQARQISAATKREVVVRFYSGAECTVYSPDDVVSDEFIMEEFYRRARRDPKFVDSALAVNMRHIVELISEQ